MLLPHLTKKQIFAIFADSYLETLKKNILG